MRIQRRLLFAALFAAFTWIGYERTRRSPNLAPLPSRPGTPIDTEILFAKSIFQKNTVGTSSIPL